MFTAHGRRVVETLAAETRHVGWSETARRSGIDRTVLHRAFRNQRLSFVTVQCVARALGYRLTLVKEGGSDGEQAT